MFGVPASNLCAIAAMTARGFCELAALSK